MASRQNFRIELDDQPVHGGDAATQREVTGIVVLLNNQVKTCDKITATLRGCALVEWSVGRGKTRRSYSSNEDYVNETIVLWNIEGVPNRRIVPGEYAFPFRFVLPDHIPSSFKGAHGHIRYTVEASMLVPALFCSTTISADVQVPPAGTRDIPPTVLTPAFAKIQEHLLLSPVPLLLNASLPRSIYSVGERIPFRACLSNDGSGRATRLKVTLIRVETFRGHGRGFRCNREAQTQCFTALETVESEEIGMRSVFEWSGSQLTVPSVLPCTAHCGIISLQYAVLFEIVISWTKNAFVNIPITLSHNAVASALMAEETLRTTATAPPYDPERTQLAATPGYPHHDATAPL